MASAQASGVRKPGTPAAAIDRDLFYISIHAAIVGGTANLLVRKFKSIQSAPDQAGARYEQVGGDLEFFPLRAAVATPAPGGDYGSAQRLTIAFDVAAERAALVSLYVVSVKDGDNFSPGLPFTGPRARDLCFYPAGGAGGLDECVTY